MKSSMRPLKLSPTNRYNGRLMADSNKGFYVIAREAGAENPAIPTWACGTDNPADLELDYKGKVTRRDLAAVPGGFQLLNLLSRGECEELVKITEALGYGEDAAVSLPRSVRHNHNLSWIADDVSNRIIWERCRVLMRDTQGLFGGRKALGLNSRFRFYRYEKGDYFAPHTDGAWPGSRVVDGELQHNAFPDRYSQLSFLLFLSDDYEGGSTQFYLNPENPGQPAGHNEDFTIVNVRTPMGGALCFPHGMHPLHCLHSSDEILSGCKYIIRSDVLFEL